MSGAGLVGADVARGHIDLAIALLAGLLLDDRLVAGLGLLEVGVVARLLAARVGVVLQIVRAAVVREQPVVLLATTNKEGAQRTRQQTIT